MKHNCKIYLALLGCLLFMFGCQKDVIDDINPEIGQHEIPDSRVLTNTGDNVSRFAINYIKQKTNNSLKVELSKKHISLIENDLVSRESAMGTVDTEKEIVVENEYNTKHTFKVKGTDESNSIINIIVVKTTYVTYEYFKKYNFDEGIRYNNNGTVNLNYFTGTIETFNMSGALTGIAIVTNGIITAEGGNNSPCPEDDDSWDWEAFLENLNNDDGNDNPNNSGGAPNNESGSGEPDGDNGSGTSGGGWFADETGGCGLDWHWVCNGGVEGAHDPDTNFNLPGNMCSGAGPLVGGGTLGTLVVTDCNGNVMSSGREIEDEDPCGKGMVGVIFDVDALKTEIEVCLGTNYNSAWFDGHPNEISEIHQYLIVNNECSPIAQDEVVSAILQLSETDCIFLFSDSDMSNIEHIYNPSLFGDYTTPPAQQDHEAIKQQFELTRTENGNLAAINYLIEVYSMEEFGQNSVNFDYTIDFAEQLPDNQPAITVPGYNSLGVMVTCSITIDIDLFSFPNFAFITTVIKHELLHVLQAQVYGQGNPSTAAREFEAYYSQIFGFPNLKRIQEKSIYEQLAHYMDEYMDQMTASEKEERQDMIERATKTFPKICNND